MVGNVWEIAGVYPTYALQAGAFLAGAFVFLKSRPLFVIRVFCYCFDDKTSHFFIKKARPWYLLI